MAVLAFDRDVQRERRAGLGGLDGKGGLVGGDAEAGGQLRDGRPAVTAVREPLAQAQQRQRVLLNVRGTRTGQVASRRWRLSAPVMLVIA